MKAVMYHYVRHHRDALPYQRYLHVDDFQRQLDLLGDEFGFVTRDQFDRALDDGHAPDGIILTFDDALRDHAQVVLPVLADRGLWGIFYVPTGPYRTGRMLAVHRIHHLVASFGGRRLLEQLLEVIDDEMLTHDRVREFHTSTYGRVDDDAWIDEFKRTLNYLIDDAHRDRALDSLMHMMCVDQDAVASEHYCTTPQLRSMRDAGMVIGSHSDSHVVLSTLDHDHQRADIEQSMHTLDQLVGPGVDSFCYPFGGFHTFTADTRQILADLGVRYAFNVEPRDISDVDLQQHPLALPRYDCNAFPFGAARVGGHPDG